MATSRPASRKSLQPSTRCSALAPSARQPCAPCTGTCCTRGHRRTAGSGGSALAAVARAALLPQAAPLPDEAKQALLALRLFFTHARPRRVRAAYHAPALLFTDGAYDEASGAGVGGVLFLPTTRSVRWFGDVVPDHMLSTRRQDGSRQVICQAELLPVVIDKILWREFLLDEACIAFVDNESARAGLMRGYSPNLHNCSLISNALALELSSGTSTWYARVPSPSNPADSPSLGQACALFPGCGQPLQYEVPWAGVASTISGATRLGHSALLTLPA